MFTEILIALFALSIRILDSRFTETETILQNGNDKFTAKMFTEVVKNNKNTNVVLSAFSVLIPLAHLVLASEGPSHDELLNAFGFHDDETTKAVSLFINEKINSIKGVVLKMANRLYVRMNYQIDDEFAEMSKNVFHTEIIKANFNNRERVATEINNWVESQTNHRIKNLVSPRYFRSDTRAVLVDALYFKGIWKYRFDEKNTKDKDFHVNNHKTIQLPTMNIKTTYKYGESGILRCKLLSLPYVGEETSLLVILPNDIEGIEQLLKLLENPFIFRTVIYGMREDTVIVSIPKFNIESTINLKSILNEINVTKIFGENANLKKLLKDSSETVYIDGAVQKTFIEVNEEGVEAAVANAMVFGSMHPSIFIPEPPKTFIADHPFVFFLREGDNILFNGVYYGS